MFRTVPLRNCPKHVEFYSKNKFEKLVHLVGFIIRFITMHCHLNVKCILCVAISHSNQYFSFPKVTQVTVRHETIKKMKVQKRNHSR